jgi:hypothetical protein
MLSERWLALLTVLLAASSLFSLLHASSLRGPALLYFRVCFYFDVVIYPKKFVVQNTDHSCIN